AHAVAPRPDAAPPAKEVAAPATTAPARPRPVVKVEEVAHAVVRVASKDGVKQARISLQPAELGSVEIRLRYHAGGITAQLAADSISGVQALQEAAGDLRRSLESQGLVVQSVDVTLVGEGDHGPQQRERTPFESAAQPTPGRDAEPTESQQTE